LVFVLLAVLIEEFSNLSDKVCNRYRKRYPLEQLLWVGLAISLSL
jgi:hypothetical protein